MSSASPAPSASACEAFLIEEARLLDEGRFDDWLALFTADATYWVPSEPHQESPLTTVSLMYDDRRLLETRVRRLDTSIHSPPPERMAIGNPLVPHLNRLKAAFEQ